VQDFQITEGPSWINSELWSIEATAQGGTKGDRFPEMLQTLLEDRFHLKVHRETKDGPVYELTVAEDGLKMRQNREGSCIPLELAKPSTDPNARPNICGWRDTQPAQAGDESVDAVGVTITDVPGVPFQSLTGQLTIQLGRQVVDRTGLSGRFDFHLEWAPERNADDPVDTGAPFLFTAVQKQLGLKLRPARGQAEVLVVDRVERPSEN
jgi:uncharacterized protein (TIGR03435 family)